MTTSPKNPKTVLKKWRIIKPIDEIIAAFEQKETINIYTLIVITTGIKCSRATYNTSAYKIINEIKKRLRRNNFILLSANRPSGLKYYYLEKFFPENKWPCQLLKVEWPSCNHRRECQSGIRGKCKVKGRE